MTSPTFPASTLSQRQYTHAVTVIGLALMQKAVAQYIADGLKVKILDVRGENAYRVIGRVSELQGGAA